MSGQSIRLALDLGTTSLAGALLTADGERLAEGQLPNSQNRYGSDVIRRLEAARGGDAKELQALLVADIDRLANNLCRQAGVARTAITAAAAAANPAITTLLRNLSPDPILFPPYRPADCSAVDFDLQKVGLNGLPLLFLFPLVNGFVGGDLIAFLFSQPSPKTPTLYIDVGTNAEMALYDGDRWQVTSVAAGPAFEGEGITSGMPYGAGAITGVRAVDNRFVFDVAGGGTPVGLCGSGLAEAIAVALAEGLIDRHGTIVDPDTVPTGFSRYLKPGKDGISLQLYRDARQQIVISQQDVRNFQLAKAAVKAGVKCLLYRAKLSEGGVEQTVLTGAFGFSLASEVLKRVDMIPSNMVDKVRFEPGGALSGVCHFLLEKDGREQLETLTSRLKPYPLSGTKAFEHAFIAAIDF
jgi:uncharacterized 2Fe-2S/4Fe-4S cluster protein (DUF4445 family)